MEKQFSQLFDFLKSKGIDTTMLEIHFKVYKSADQIMKSRCSDSEYEKWKGKKSRCRTYLCGALEYLYDFGIISVEQYTSMLKL